MTPRDLINMLAQWDLDSDFEVLIRTDPQDEVFVVLLEQKSNTINLSADYINL